MLVSEGQPGRARWEGQGVWRVAGALQSFDFMPAGSPDASMQSTMGSTMSYEDEDDSESMVYVEAPKVPPPPPRTEMLALCTVLESVVNQRSR